MADGIVTYKCDTCNRQVDVQYNRHGIDTAQRCIITDGCLGTLHKVKRRLVPARAKVLADPVEGLDYWYQKKMIYTHVQAIAANVWRIKHNLGVIPVLKTYVTRYDENNQPYLIPAEPTVTYNDIYSLTLTFDSFEAGEVQCFTVTSENKNIVPPPVVSKQNVLVTNKGELTIAVRYDIAQNLFTDSETFPLTVTFLASPQFQYTYRIDNRPSILSSWVDADDSLVVINRTNYKVFSFNVFNSDIAATGVTSAPITIPMINLTPVAANQVLILLATSPFTVYDKTTDHLVDTFSSTTSLPTLFYVNGETYCDPTTIVPTYPPIFYR
jgi:hypothetical protein